MPTATAAWGKLLRQQRAAMEDKGQTREMLQEVVGLGLCHRKGIEPGGRGRLWDPG